MTPRPRAISGISASGNDQHLAVVADNGDGVALGRHADARRRALAWGQHLLAGAGLRQRLVAGTTKPRPSLAATSSFMPGR